MIARRQVFVENVRRCLQSDYLSPGRRTIFSPLRDGNWQRIFQLSASALICGFFWEMWKSYSYAKWIYSIPLVQKFHILEMPILGCAGYLPFGLECGIIADFCDRLSEDYGDG